MTIYLQGIIFTSLLYVKHVVNVRKYLLPRGCMPKIDEMLTEFMYGMK